MAHIWVTAVADCPGAAGSSACPITAEMSQSGREIQLVIAMPGCDEKHLRVYAGPRAVAVEGSIVRPDCSAPSDVVFTEFTGRKLARRFELPEEISPEEVKAYLHNGILTIVAVKAKVSRVRRTVMAARV